MATQKQILTPELESSLREKLGDKLSAMKTRQEKTRLVASTLFLEHAVYPSAALVRDFTRHGSITDIQKDLDDFWDMVRKKTRSALPSVPAEFADEAGALILQLWNKANATAIASLDAERQRGEDEIAQAKQNERTAIAQREETNASLTAAHAELARAREDLAHEREKVAQEALRVATLTGERQQLNEALAALRAETTRQLEEIRTASERTIAEARAGFETRLAESTAQFETRLAESRAQFDKDLAAEREARRADHDAAEGQRKFALGQIEQARQAEVIARQEIEALRLTTKQEREVERSENKALIAENAKLKADKDNLTKRVAELTANIKELSIQRGRQRKLPLG